MIATQPVNPLISIVIKNPASDVFNVLDKLEADKKAEILLRAREAEIKRLEALSEKLSTAPIKPNSFDWGNCTWLVAGILDIRWSGDANQWAYNAEALGYTVNDIPEIGAVAQTSGGWAGHVAVVLKVNGDEVLIREMNYEGFDVDSQRWVNVGEFRYIHLG